MEEIINKVSLSMLIWLVFMAIHGIFSQLVDKEIPAFMAVAGFVLSFAYSFTKDYKDH